MPYPPVFAKGKTNERTCNNFDKDTTTIIGTAIQAGDFPVGSRVWTSYWLGGATPTICQYRGTVVTQQAGQITVTLGAKEDNTGTTKVWRPTNQYLPLYAVQSPYIRRRDHGIETTRALDGTVYRTQTRLQINTILLRFRSTTDDFEAWYLFVSSVLLEGVENFTVAWYDYLSGDYQTMIAMLLERTTEFRELSVGVAEWGCELALQNAAGYA